MAQIWSSAHSICIINGHEVNGLAREDRPFEWNTGQDMYNLMRGEDGGLYGVANLEDIGGTLTMRLAPNSPTSKWAVDEKQAWRNSILRRQGFRNYNCSLADPVQGRSIRASGGFLLRAAHLPEPGQTHEVHFAWELLDPNVAGALFRAPFSSDAVAAP